MGRWRSRRRAATATKPLGQPAPPNDDDWQPQDYGSQVIAGVMIKDDFPPYGQVEAYVPPDPKPVPGDTGFNANTAELAPKLPLADPGTYSCRFRWGRLPNPDDNWSAWSGVQFVTLS